VSSCQFCVCGGGGGGRESHRMVTEGATEWVTHGCCLVAVGIRTLTAASVCDKFNVAHGVRLSKHPFQCVDIVGLGSEASHVKQAPRGRAERSLWRRCLVGSLPLGFLRRQHSFKHGGFDLGACNLCGDCHSFCKHPHLCGSSSFARGRGVKSRNRLNGAISRGFAFGRGKKLNVLDFQVTRKQPLQLPGVGPSWDLMCV
jgi:hypothetical protein